MSLEVQKEVQEDSVVLVANELLDMLQSRDAADKDLGITLLMRYPLMGEYDDLKKIWRILAFYCVSFYVLRKRPVGFSLDRYYPYINIEPRQPWQGHKDYKNEKHRWELYHKMQVGDKIKCLIAGIKREGFPFEN